MVVGYFEEGEELERINKRMWCVCGWVVGE
jgi:hypothetical protein